MGSEHNNNDTALILEHIKMVNDTMNQNFQTIRDDIRRMEDDHRKEIQALETRVTEKVETTQGDVDQLAESHAALDKKVERHGMVVKVGGAGVALILGEFIKRYFFNGS